jgi:hypothetical protein
MANVYATKTGNWSDTTVWNTGALPTASDDVRPNGFTVTINQDITVTTLLTNASSPAVAGGTFIVSGNGRIINANLQVGTSIVLSCSTNINWFLNGNIGAYTAVNISTISMTGGGSFTMVGNVLGNGGASSNGTSIRSTATMNINITGNVTGGGNSTCHGVAIDLTAGGNINITGNILGGSAVNATGVLLNNSGQILTVNGTITGGTNVNSNFGVQNNAGTLQGNCIAQGASTINGAQGVFANGTNTTTTISEAIYNDNAPTSGKVRFKNINPKVTVVKANATTQQLVEAGASGDFPIAANVRNGITYANASLTGTLIVPTPDNVRKGVATDATVGTADLTAADMWNALTSSMTTAGSIGERLKNASTVQSNGDQLAAYIV